MTMNILGGTASGSLSIGLLLDNMDLETKKMILRLIINSPSFTVSGRRKAKREAQKVNSKIPNLKDHDGVQKFFVQEVEMGEELLAQGDLEGGIEHLANAVAVCAQPHQLLQVFQKTLAPQVFHLLLQRLPATGQKLNSQTSMMEEDVE